MLGAPLPIPQRHISKEYITAQILRGSFFVQLIYVRHPFDGRGKDVLRLEPGWELNELMVLPGVHTSQVCYEVES